MQARDKNSIETNLKCIGICPGRRQKQAVNTEHHSINIYGSEG